jgi:alpha-amylase
MKLSSLALSLALAAGAAIPVSAAISDASPRATKPFLWDNATVYFLLTDRFNNAHPGHPAAYGRKSDAAPLRGYMGGDLAGITAKIREGYFNSLGVNAIWINPPVEQIHAGTDEGTGMSYGFHGYWARDWTQVDANLGTEADWREFVDTAHAHGIRVLLDVVMNQVGPVTAQDPAWPESWVRTNPVCTHRDTAGTVSCALVKNLPDMRTDSNEAVDLPPALVAKWKSEGRYEQQMKELDEFFARTGYPRAPRYYLIKWHADWVRKYGIDGFRGDTVKHVEPGVWKELKQVASAAFEDWKRANPAKKLSDDRFFTTAEIYSYNIASGLEYTFGDGESVNFYANGFDSSINFGFKDDAKRGYEDLFSTYSAHLHGPLKGYSVLNYVSSHDDEYPFDGTRTRAFEAATKLMLAPGSAQIYYGDETARDLLVSGAKGDARLRSPMNWDELASNATKHGYRVGDLRAHWSRLGLFRQAHVAVGAGVHTKLQDQPYTFKRTYEKNGVSDKVVVALDVPADASGGIAVNGVFADGQRVKDYYSGKVAVVAGGKANFGSTASTVLIGQE